MDAYAAEVHEAGLLASSEAEPEDLAKRRASLRQRRLELSGAIAEQVLGLDPAKQKHPLDEGSILSMIRTGRDARVPTGSGASPSAVQAEVLQKMAQLDPQAQDEVSFCWFISALWHDGPGVFVPDYIEEWSEHIDLVSDYTATASLYPGMLWYYLQPKGLRQKADKMQEVLDMCRREMPLLHEQRFTVSETVLRDVFEITDPDLLHQVATGEPAIE
jgi:hypothetical protein